MVRDEERRKIAKKLRAGAEYLPNDMYSDDLELELAKTVCGYDTPSVDVLFNRLAELIEPERTWHEFSDEIPPVGASVLCMGKNGALYVGKSVTLDGEGTSKVWVPRGGQYRSPAKWMVVEK